MDKYLYDPSDYKNSDGLYAFSDEEIKDDIDYYYGNFGFKDAAGNVVIQPKFLYASQFSEGYAVVCTKWHRCENCLPSYYEFNYIDKNGNIVFEEGFLEAHNFNKYGVAAVWKNKSDLMYLIDKRGLKIEGSSFKHIGEYNNPDERYYTFHSVDDSQSFYWDSPIGLYDTKDRKVVFTEKYRDIEVISDNMFFVEKYTGKNPFDTEEKYVDMNGSPIYMQQAGRGFSTVTIPNTTGDSIVSYSTYELLPDTATAWMPIDGKKYKRVFHYGVIDKDGNFLIDTKYQKIEDLSDGTYKCISFENDEQIIQRTK